MIKYSNNNCNINNIHTKGLPIGIIGSAVFKISALCLKTLHSTLAVVLFMSLTIDTLVEIPQNYIFVALKNVFIMAVEQA